MSDDFRADEVTPAAEPYPDPTETDPKEVDFTSPETDPTVSVDDEPEPPEQDPADVESDVAGGPEYPVVEVQLSDEEREAQEAHEALAADLPVGQTLPWVAETPSVVYDRLVEEAQKDDSDE